MLASILIQNGPQCAFPKRGNDGGFGFYRHLLIIERNAAVIKGNRKRFLLLGIG